MNAPAEKPSAPQSPGGAQQELQFTRVDPPGDTSQQRGYVASALTHLDAPARREIELRCDLIERHLADHFAIKAHVPKDHTSPHGHDELDPSDVNRIDLNAVLDADLLVYLADRPADGAGKEVAWAERNGTPIVVLSPVDTHLSRLLAGSTSDITERVFTDDRSLVAELHAAVHKRREAIASHRQWREDRQALDEYRRSLSVPNGTLPGGLTVDRAEEIRSSNNQLDNASLSELRQMDPLLNDHVTSRAMDRPPASPPSDVALDSRQLDALDNAAHLNAWPASVVARKVTAYLSAVTASPDQALRASFTSVEDWESLDG